MKPETIVPGASRSLELHRQPAHHAGTEKVSQRMFSMRVVEGVKYGNRQLRFATRTVSRDLLPEPIGPS